MPTIFITGAGRRLGKHLAMLFADCEYNIAIGYNKSQEKAEKLAYCLVNQNINAKTFHIDVRNEKSVKDAIQMAFKDFSQIDVLLNNAGIFPPATSLDEIKADFWDDVMNINLRGQMFCAKHYANFAKQGRIINIASLGAVEIWKRRIPYNVSKAGVIQLTKALARDLAPDFSVNCILPGTIDIPDEEPPEKLISADRTPMKRHGRPKDVFDAALFFAEASKFITAQSIAVDGGYHDAR